MHLNIPGCVPVVTDGKLVVGVSYHIVHGLGNPTCSLLDHVTLKACVFDWIDIAFCKLGKSVEGKKKMNNFD
jgi:hypothetical protein